MCTIVMMTVVLCDDFITAGHEPEGISIITYIRKCRQCGFLSISW